MATSKTSPVKQGTELSHSMVHYLLSIHKLKESNGYARVTDIARHLNLTKGSVSTALNALKKKGYVQEDESKFLSLSDKGHDQVHQILSSRTLLYYFLKEVLNVSEEAAKLDSCLMEHLISKETSGKFFEFLKDANSKKMIKTTLDFSKYNNVEDFLEDQKGDSFLVED